MLGQNQSIYAETESTFVIIFTFAVVQKPKCPIKLMTKAGIYGFRSSPGYDIQLRDSNFVLQLQSIARSKPKLLLRKHNNSTFALRSQPRIQVNARDYLN